MPKTFWGVDSAANVTEELYNCVSNNYGVPVFWGRYITTVAGAAEGLTPEEISFLHQKGVKILPIYSGFTRAVGDKEGRITARNAIFNARRLGIPKNTFIFANIEKFFEVDEGWLRGWVDVFYRSGYRPGFYHDPVSGGFSSAFCSASQNSEKVKIQSVLWSAEPETGNAKKAKAPNFNPISPPCGGNVWAWQYSRNLEVCPIDTNLIDQRLLNNLW